MVLRKDRPRPPGSSNGRGSKRKPLGTTGFGSFFPLTNRVF